MIKKCKECGTVAEGTEEEIKETFRKVGQWFRGICKPCEYKKFKKDYYKPPSLRDSYDAEQGITYDNI